MEIVHENKRRRNKLIIFTSHSENAWTCQEEEVENDEGSCLPITLLTLSTLKN